MADDAMATAIGHHPRILVRATTHRVRRLTTLFVAVAAGGILCAAAERTVLGRYVRYRAEDAAHAARREVRLAVDALHGWWRHVEKTVAARDRRRGRPAPEEDAPRWVGMVDVRRP